MDYYFFGSYKWLKTVGCSFFHAGASSNRFSWSMLMFAAGSEGRPVVPPVAPPLEPQNATED